VTPRAQRALARIVRPVSYTCRLERNHNNFVLDALERWHMIERRGGFALPTPLGNYTVHYLEDREGATRP
jgi:hypothetical protein